MAEEQEEGGPREAQALMYEDLFAETKADDMKESAIAECKDRGFEDKSFTYSEFDFPTMHGLMNNIAEKAGPMFERGVFIDFGSGCGKACLAAALQHPFDKVVGIEILQGLHDAAMSVSQKYQEADTGEDAVKPEVQFIKGDFVADFEAQIEPLLTESAFCLAVCTCFGDKEMQALASVAKRMIGGSFLVTFSQPLPDSVVIDNDRHPAQRRAAAVRKACARRGVEPCPPEDIEVDPPENDPDGVELVFRDLMEVPWAEKSTVFVYKKASKEEIQTEDVVEE